jgi:hypothetical protein
MNPIKIRFASKEEAQKLILGNTQYYNRLSQMDIDWRARKADATLDELIAFAQEQVSDFTENNMDVVMQCMSFIERQLDLLGCQLPVPDEIIFVKTNMKDESNASAYTTRNLIFLNESLLSRYNDPGQRSPSVRFFNHIDISLVALDDLEHPFHFEEASDFWDKMGENTDYVNAPEECLAVNFSYAIIFGMNYKY